MLTRQMAISTASFLFVSPSLSSPLKAAIVSDAIRLHRNDMFHAFTVISPGMVRIRRDL